MKVAVCVPCRDQVATGFSFDLAQLVGYHSAAGMNIGLYHSPGTLIADQRCTLARKALDEGATDILWIDSDMRFPKDALQRLLSHGKNIVAANYVQRGIPVVPVSLRLTPEKWVHVPTLKDSTGLEEVTAAGMGLMLTSTQVFKDLPEPWFHIGYSSRNNKFIGEDVSFCLAAAANGHSTYIDHDISKNVRHIGAFEFRHEHLESDDGDR